MSIWFSIAKYEVRFIILVAIYFGQIVIGFKNPISVRIESTSQSGQNRLNV